MRKALPDLLPVAGRALLLWRGPLAPRLIPDIGVAAQLRASTLPYRVAAQQANGRRRKRLLGYFAGSGKGHDFGGWSGLIAGLYRGGN